MKVLHSVLKDTDKLNEAIGFLADSKQQKLSDMDIVNP